MLIFSAAFSIGRCCGGGAVRCFSLAAKFTPWPKIRNRKSPPPRISSVPHLMLFSPTKPYIRYLCRLERNNRGATMIKIDRDIYQPEIAGFHLIIGSSHGFVFTLPGRGSASGFDDNADIVAINPLSGDKLPLPSIRYLDYDIPIDRPFEEDPLATIHSKLILSPSRDIAVLIRRNHWGDGYADFARLKPMDDAWAPIPLRITNFDDCIFHKGRFIVVNHAGDFTTFNHTGDPSDPQTLTSCGDVESDEAYRKYLVESPDGDELFLVCRKEEKDDEYGNPAPQRTCSFCVLRLDKNDGYMWKPVDSLGGLAFFVGTGGSFSLPAADFPSLKPNSIYFTTDVRICDHLLPDFRGLGDTGVFDLQDGTIEFFRLPDTRNRRKWLPPAWVVPTTC